MAPSNCFVVACNSGNRSCRDIVLFKAPKNNRLLCTWKIKLRRRDKQLTKNSRVCQKHFVEDDIIKVKCTKGP